LNVEELRGEVLSAELLPLPAGSPWQALADCIKRSLLAHSERVQDLEHARTVLEIRYRRASSLAQRATTILSGVGDPILAIDELDEIVLANPAAEELFALALDRAEDRAIAHVVRCQKLVDMLLTACHRESIVNRSDEFELVDSRGQNRWYRARAARLTCPEGDDERSAGSQGAVLVLRDIGDQKALQMRNAEFVSSVSHEMKSPLAGIKAYVELLADGDAEDEETREQFLEVINSQTDRLQRLIDNMLNLARIEAGVVHVSKEQRSLNELLDEAVHVVQPSAEAKKVTLLVQLSPLYLGVLADRDMLLQAAINLFSNAIKYTPQGGQVTIRSRLGADQVIFEVEDTGVGLSEEDCQKVFEKFYRVKKDKEMASGTGLGLPLAQHIVQDVHGGQLTVQSKLGVGSIFRVALPNAKQMT
jgi:two-component system phosphate regulon sensor histidine kinase PhoR